MKYVILAIICFCTSAFAQNVNLKNYLNRGEKCQLFLSSFLGDDIVPPKLTGLELLANRGDFAPVIPYLATFENWIMNDAGSAFRDQAPNIWASKQVNRRNLIVLIYFTGKIELSIPFRQLNAEFVPVQDLAKNLVRDVASAMIRLRRTSPPGELAGLGPISLETFASSRPRLIVGIHPTEKSSDFLRLLEKVLAEQNQTEDLDSATPDELNEIEKSIDMGTTLGENLGKLTEVLAGKPH